MKPNLIWGQLSGGAGNRVSSRRRQLFLQAVDLDEDPVQLFLVGLELAEAGDVFGIPLLCICQLSVLPFIILLAE